MWIITGCTRPIPNLHQSARSSHFSTALLLTVIAILITSQSISPHAPSPLRWGAHRAGEQAPGTLTGRPVWAKGRKWHRQEKKANQGKDTTAAGPTPASSRGPTLRSRSPALGLAVQLAQAGGGCPAKHRPSIQPPLPRDAPAAQPGRRLPMSSAGRDRLGGPGEPEPRPGPWSREPGGRAPALRSPGPAGCPCLSGGGPGPSSPQPGAGRREVARAQAGAVATLTHGGDGGGGGSSPSVTSAAGAACRGPGRRGRQRAWLRAGGAGCARGPRRLPRLRLRLRLRPGAVAWAGWPATSPALLGSAQPGLGGAARPARAPVSQSLSPSVVPSGHRSPPQERSEKQTAGRAAHPLPVTQPSAHQSKGCAGPSHHPHSFHQPIRMRKSLPPPTPPPPLSPQHPLSCQLIIGTTP